MRREVALPPEFASLTGSVHYIQQVSRAEFSSSCPKCGGDVHQDGSWPDRLRLFLADTGGRARVWCRQCSWFAWGDSLDPNTTPPSHAELDRWKDEQIVREQARRRSADHALKLLQDSDRWQVYHEQLGAKEIAYWTRRGVPEAFQNYWELGWARNKPFGGVICDSATIPLFSAGGDVLNIKHRLIDESAGRYRYELQGLEAPPFLCTPGQALGNEVYAIEGEIKSMVTFAKLDDSKISMIGLPGTNPGANVIESLSNAERVVLVMDPGARLQAWNLAKAIGLERTWVLITPVKIDDGILDQRMDKWQVQHLLAQAVSADPKHHKYA